MSLIETIPLHETARSRYLNYALSVITSRALPDIRDGLKPVQRRILYAMFASLRLYPDGRYRKSATIVGECFVRDTLVATENGLIPIQEIRRGDRVYTETGLKPVTELYEMPEKKLLRIGLENGISNTVTSEQPIRVLNDELGLVWKDAKELHVGDWVVLKKAPCLPEKPVELGLFGGKQIILDEEVSYILGALVSDGWISADYGTKKRLRLGFCSSDLGVIEKIRRCFTSVFNYTPTIEVGKSVYTVRLNNAALNTFFAKHFELTASLTAHTKFIPQKVLQSPASVVYAFVAGLFDGDGCLDARHARARYVTVSKRLIDQLQVLLQHLGILAGRHTLREVNPDWAPLHSLEIHAQYAKKLISQVKFERANLKARAALIRPIKTYPSSLERVPYGSKAVFAELSANHLGGGWYEDPAGNKFRQGITYPDGTKIRYCAELQEKPLAISQLEDWGILDKLDRIGSPLYDTLRYFIEHDLFFVQVKSVEDVAPERTYDLQVAEDHNFIANGMVAHNCMGKFHPHGDTAIYDAMVRMAQPFSLRDPLVDGHGNFGSLDGDSPAAMRYTEAKLRTLAMEMLVELRQQTVAFRPTFDGTLSEPVVLPSRFPNLLVNGATGIAVGMATNIPPHNLGEVVDACLYMVDARRKQVKEGRGLEGWPAVRIQTLVNKYIKGPDFPTGGRILNTEDELFEIYKTGEGAVHLRGEYKKEGKSHILITSIPYTVTKGDLVEKIAEHIATDRVPQLTDIRDESTDEVRVVLELKRGANADAAMAYLFKHTPLQLRFHVNLTCLVPTDNPQVSAPEKVDLATILHHFLDFRLDVVTRRLQHELEQLEKRIHILEGFEKIFDAIDEAIKIIRSSKNKADSSQRLRHRFRLDEVQAEAVLETKLYKLSQLEIEAIQEELEAKKTRAAEIRALLKDEAARWAMVRNELKTIKQQYATERRSDIAGPDATKYEYSEEDFIVDEDAYVIVTRDGWVKRQRSYTEMDNIRIREGDEIGWILPGRTRNTVAFLTNFGRAYTVRVDELPSTTGYGAPVQKLFGFTDKECVVGVVSFDPRVLPKAMPDPDLEPDLFKRNGEVRQDKAVPYLVAFSRNGMAVRLTIDGYTEPSTKNGRLFMRPAKDDEVVGAEVAGGDENACLASRNGHVLIFPVKQIPIFKSAGKGVIAMRLSHDDRILGATVATGARDGLEVETNRGRREIVRTTKFEVTNRGNKGRQIIQRGHLERVIVSPMEIRLNGTK